MSERDKSFKDILQAFGERSKNTHRYEFVTDILHKLPRKYAPCSLFLFPSLHYIYASKINSSSIGYSPRVEDHY